VGSRCAMLALDLGTGEIENHVLGTIFPAAWNWGGKIQKA